MWSVLVVKALGTSLPSSHPFQFFFPFHILDTHPFLRRGLLSRTARSLASSVSLRLPSLLGLPQLCSTVYQHARGKEKREHRASACPETPYQTAPDRKDARARPVSCRQELISPWEPRRDSKTRRNAKIKRGSRAPETAESQRRAPARQTA